MENVIDIEVGDLICEYFTKDNSGYVKGKVVEVHPMAYVITDVTTVYGKEERKEVLNYIVPKMSHLDNIRDEPRIEKLLG